MNLTTETFEKNQEICNGMIIMGDESSERVFIYKTNLITAIIYNKPLVIKNTVIIPS